MHGAVYGTSPCRVTMCGTCPMSPGTAPQNKAYMGDWPQGSEMYGSMDPITNTTTHGPCTPDYYPPGYECTKETQVRCKTPVNSTHSYLMAHGATAPSVHSGRVVYSLLQLASLSQPVDYDAHTGYRAD